MSLFETYTRGFLAACKNLTALEIETLRGCADHDAGMRRSLFNRLSGRRHVFKIHRPDHNLIPAGRNLHLPPISSGTCRSCRRSLPLFRAADAREPDVTAERLMRYNRTVTNTGFRQAGGGK